LSAPRVKCSEPACQNSIEIFSPDSELDKYSKAKPEPEKDYKILEETYECKDGHRTKIYWYNKTKPYFSIGTTKSSITRGDRPSSRYS
jgi:hypothetical protein